MHSENATEFLLCAGSMAIGPFFGHTRVTRDVTVLNLLLGSEGGEKSEPGAGVRDEVEHMKHITVAHL